MKLKQIRFLLGILLLTAVITFIAVENTQAQTGPNLLQNPGFEEGHYNQGGIAEITVPNGWKMHWLDGRDYDFTYQEFPAARPETVVWNGNNGASIPVGEEHFWRDGNYTVKIFKGYAPMYAAMSQDVAGLQVGRNYRLTAPVLTDVYDWNEGKVYPSDTRHDAIRLGASPLGAAWLDGGQIAYGGFWTPTYGQYQLYTYDFTATQPEMTIWVEMMAGYPRGNNGFFIDGVSLHALDSTGSVSSGGGGSVAAQPVNTPTPFPTPEPRTDGSVVHVVQANDSFWALAIRYASTMNLTPEEALATLQSLNANVQFLSPGMELIVVPPSADGGRSEAESSPDVTAAETETESEGEATTEEAAVEAEPTPEPTAVPAVNDEPSPTTNEICLTSYDDANANALYDAGEGLLSDAVLTVSTDNGTVATYVTTGMQEPYCFTDLPANTYQVRFSPPADYQPTTPINWAVTVADGVQMSAEFGAQFAPANSSETADAATTEESADTTRTGSGLGAALDTGNAAPESEGSSNIGLIAIGIALGLVLLAGAGVVLLRRS